MWPDRPVSCRQAGTSLSPRVHEIVILTVGTALNSRYELYAHSVVARRAGLAEDVIRAIETGHAPALNDEQEATAYEFTRQLLDEYRIDSETYARSAEAFGHKGLVDVVVLIGLYLTICTLINAFEVSVPKRVR
jgi:4-carboxymuconolactone decarboxylase